VYDGTAFLKDHPGGAESILLASGMDSSDDFNAIHSVKAKRMLNDYEIGVYDETAPSNPPPPRVADSFLRPYAW